MCLLRAQFQLYLGVRYYKQFLFDDCLLHYNLIVAFVDARNLLILVVLCALFFGVVVKVRYDETLD